MIGSLDTMASNIGFLNESTPQTIEFYVRYCLSGEAYTSAL